MFLRRHEDVVVRHAHHRTADNPKISPKTVLYLLCLPLPLEEVDGIGPERRPRIKDAWAEQKVIRNCRLPVQAAAVSASIKGAAASKQRAGGGTEDRAI
jgi:hypothetical protein